MVDLIQNKTFLLMNPFNENFCHSRAFYSSNHSQQIQVVRTDWCPLDSSTIHLLDYLSLLLYYFTTCS